MIFKIPKFIKSIFGKNSIEREIPKLEKTTQEINKFAPELKGTSDNGAWGYLANVETEVEQGTPEIFHGANTHIPSRTIGPSAGEEVGTSQFIGSGIHSKSKTVDNMVFPKKDTADAKGKSENNTSSSNDTSAPEHDAPSPGSTGTSTGKSNNNETGTTKFVSSNDPRIGTTDSDGNFYMPDDISGGGFTASAKQHAYRKAYEKASNVDDWQKKQLFEIVKQVKPESMSEEAWAKQQNKQIVAINKQADQIRNNWSKMQNNADEITTNVSDYVLGNPHTMGTIAGAGTLGYLALQLSDSRGQMTNQQLYGQDDLT